MSVYRRNYVTASKRRKSKFWTVEVQHKAGRVIREGGFRTREAAKHREAQLRIELDHGAVGIVTKGKRLLLSELIDQYVEHLENLKRGEGYIYVIKIRLGHLASEAGWLQIGDVDALSFNRWRSPNVEKKRHNAKTLKPRTINQYLEAARGFMTWAVKQGYTKANPLLHVDKATIDENNDYRRAATIDEIRKLLSVVRGPRRAFYIFALYVPLRRKTLERITWADVHLDAAQPWLNIRAENVKSRKVEKSALPPQVVTLLRAMEGKPHEKVFPDAPWIDEIRSDLEAAGVSFSDARGRRRLDLHAFRRTAIRWMKANGVSLEHASLALHHKDIKTTKRYYDEDELEPKMVDAVSKMPDVTG